MTDEELDRLMGRLAPPVTVSSERAGRVVAGVMLRLDDLPAASASASASASGRLLAGWLLALGRFALPMAAAAMLGVVVGEGMRPAEDGTVFSQLLAQGSYGGVEER